MDLRPSDTVGDEEGPRRGPSACVWLVVKVAATRPPSGSCVYLGTRSCAPVRVASTTPICCTRRAWFDSSSRHIRGPSCIASKAEEETGSLLLYTPAHSCHPLPFGGVGAGLAADPSSTCSNDEGLGFIPRGDDRARCMGSEERSEGLAEVRRSLLEERCHPLALLCAAEQPREQRLLCRETLGAR